MVSREKFKKLSLLKDLIVYFPSKHLIPMLIIPPTKPQDIEARFNLKPNTTNFDSLRDSQEQISSYFPFTLTRQQQKALHLLGEFLNSPETFFLLGGYAGTGKSTIVFALVKKLINARKRVALTAPTNKAVAILKNMAFNNNISGVSCLTIHQLLGLGMVNRGAKKVLQATSPSTVHLYDVVFLDECSMVGEDLWNWIERVFDTSLFTKRKLILMGDPAQLNPVGEKRSPTFQIQKRTILTQVVRQAGESPLLDFVTACRKTVHTKTTVFHPFSSSKSGDKSNGTFPVKPRTLVKYATQKIQREFERNCNCFRLLCYTNKQVNRYNRLIREAIYGKNAPRFLLGERLITRNPVFAPDGKTIILPTSTEVTVIETSETKYYGYQTYQLNVGSSRFRQRLLFLKLNSNLIV